MKIKIGIYFTIGFFLCFSFIKAQTTILLQENFTNYDGTSATVPAGWNFSYNGNYTSTTYSGTSGPNSYKFGVNNATIITPSFANAESVLFWLKGASVDTASYLTIYETYDSITWTIVSTIKPLSASGTSYKFPVNNASIHLKFFYFKSAGNLAFDDFLVIDHIVYPSSGDIKIYFNNPVDTSVSSGVNAIYLNQSMDDTLVAYINRANYSIDVAVYNYVQSAAIANIATAINNAYNRGVKIRWIYDVSASNTGLTLLNANINKLASPALATYGLMHNKFMIVDMQSPNPYHAMVWTGSTNWNASQFNSDVNNTIIIQDKNLGYAFTMEFNEMWGDTGLVPNASLSKFGPYKTDNTYYHSFNIGGKIVEVYFSPSDKTNSRLLSSIASADNDLYFGIFAFTLNANADSIKNKIQNGVYVAGIMDQFSQIYPPYTTLQPVMGNNLKLYTSGSSLYHNKFLIADACDISSDPLVFTGSHNWSSSAETKNDENTLIIHDATIANIYYQSFYKDFLGFGDTLVLCATVSVNEIFSVDDFIMFPNPSSGKFNLKISQFENLRMSRIEIYNVFGENIFNSNHFQIDTFSNFQIDLGSHPSGIYFLLVKTEKDIFSKKIILR